MKQTSNLCRPIVFALVLVVAGAAAAQTTADRLAEINAWLAASSAVYRVEKVEWVSVGNPAGQIVFFDDHGNKQLGTDYVPFDPRRGGFGDIATIIDGTEGATSNGLTEPETTAAIERALQTWEDVNCSTIPLFNIGSVPVPLGVVQFFLGGPFPAAILDVTHAGWLPQAFFDATFPPAAPNVLAATFTFVFIDASLNPTDIDNNGKADTAFAETYYNDSFGWAIDDNIDVQTVALHETGHGLSQAHNGKLFLTGNGKFHFAPRAVMNAGYTGVQQELTGTDNAGHCSLWAQWPNN